MCFPCASPAVDYLVICVLNLRYYSDIDECAYKLLEILLAFRALWYRRNRARKLCVLHHFEFVSPLLHTL